MPLTAVGLEGLPEIGPGDDLAAALATPLREHGVRDDDVLVVAHKIVSKAEGRILSLAEVVPTDRARALAAQTAPPKDPRAVQVVLDEAVAILRAERGVLIARTHHGLVCANAGVDASNVARPDAVVLLPNDPDGSARALRDGVERATGARPAVLVSDSFGRAWRHGQCDVALGCAGLAPLEDWRGRGDAEGRVMRATWIAVADQVAAAADLVRTKDGRVPAVLVRGLARHVTRADGPGAAALVRPPDEDLFG